MTPPSPPAAPGGGPASLQDAGRPAALARATSDSTAPSHLGGTPELPTGVEWPKHQQQPLAFLARLDLSDIQAALPTDWLPAVGTLLFFYDAKNQPWGFDPKEAGSWKVVYAAADTPLVATPSPRGAETFGRVSLEFHPITTFSQEGFLSPSDEIDEEEREDLFEALQEQAYGDFPHHQVGGVPDAVQNEGMEDECQLASHGVYCGDSAGYTSEEGQALMLGSSDWRLLFQIDSDEAPGWMWGDTGILYFWVRESDARQGDFSRVWVCLQCC